MSENYTTHKAGELIDSLDNFQIWPFTENTGCPISDLHEPHLHDFYVVQYVTKGRGLHVIDFQPFDIVPNSLYFVSPQQLHIWRPEGEVDGFVLAFAEEFFKTTDPPFGSVFELEFFNSVAHSPMLHASDEQARIIHDSLALMQKEFMDKNEGYASVVRAQFHILMVQLQRMFSGHIEEGREAHEPSLVRQFKDMVSRHYASQLSIQDYADKLGVSVSRLNNAIKDAIGQTPGQVVRRELLLAAKRMLAHSDLNVSEICFKLNFEDPSYFGRFFKREAGVTPSVFRDQMREKYQQLAR
ncbi:AraC family transcriptional regulator [Pseudodesulfovibrio sp. zrk46]|uniref:helix-turn-helix domain-containing protein n=1 Tax=Pseudodesulfovibrio sp. zrk46 TaxID=2725288 RepID=UPI001449612B|nr:AraC family transcriptional regulator [Pseudodesulfovibrio sp. zrk46]QJB57240.1 helix-turn-helix domain-containing protein [Pseudodesulfovibrio sp. zrk46]